MRSIKTDLNELCDAYAMNNEEIDHYLDAETGEVIVRLDPVLTGERDEEWDEELEFKIGTSMFRKLTPTPRTI